jgi:hypothetical protein
MINVTIEQDVIEKIEVKNASMDLISHQESNNTFQLLLHRWRNLDWI